MGQSLGRRIAVAVALLVGFYLLAFGLAAALVGVVIAQWTIDDAPRFIWLSFACLAAAFAIVRAMVPRRAPFVAPGPRLDPAAQPELDALVREVAEATGEEPPAETYLAHDFNAAVTERGGFMGLGGKRVLIVGLPLLETLTVDQLRSVIAHEFGHYSGRDTKLGSFFFRTYDAISRAIANLDARESIWRHLFVIYGRFFLRRTAQLRRGQEFAADAVAAEVTGREVTAGTLRSVTGCGGAFEAYLSNEFAPVVDSGALPPFREGFARFRSVSQVQEQTKEYVTAQLAAETDAYDTHPSTGERLAALGVDPEAAAGGNGPPASTLLRDPDGLEKALMQQLLGDHADSVRPIDWDDVPERVMVPGWRRSLAEAGSSLDGVAVRDFPGALDRLRDVGGDLFPVADGTPPDVRRDVAAAFLGRALALALHDAGWQLSADPGEPITFARDGASFDPFELARPLGTAEMDAGQWRRRVDELGIGDLVVRREQGSEQLQPA